MNLLIGLRAEGGPQTDLVGGDQVATLAVHDLAAQHRVAVALGLAGRQLVGAGVIAGRTQAGVGHRGTHELEPIERVQEGRGRPDPSHLVALQPSDEVPPDVSGQTAGSFGEIAGAILPEVPMSVGVRVEDVAVGGGLRHGDELHPGRVTACAAAGGGDPIPDRGQSEGTHATAT